MDITLIPGKLNGSINARPSVSCGLLHAIAQELSQLQKQSGRMPADLPLSENQMPVPEGKPVDFLRQPQTWSETLEVTEQCFRALPQDAPTLNCGENHAAFYLMVPIAAAFKHKVSFTGTEEYPNSMIVPLAEALKRRNVRFSKGNLKIRRRDRNRLHEICTLSGKLEYGYFSLTGREDPRFLTGLLFVLPLLEGNSSVRMTTMPDSAELPLMAVSVMRQYGIEVNRSVDDYGYPVYEIPGNQVYRIPESIVIEGDWEKAAFWLACGALGGNVTVRGLSGDSTQNARQILDKLRSLGAATGIGEDGANVISGPLKGCNINAARIPQLVPVLSVLLANASGNSMLTGISCDEYASVYRVLSAFDADISNGGSGFSFTGKPILSGGEIDADGDPVIAMVATAAAGFCRMPVTIRNAGSVNKVYPGFFEDFAALGGKIER